jgi:hypothetical protein
VIPFALPADHSVADARQRRTASVRGDARACRSRCQGRTALHPAVRCPPRRSAGESQSYRSRSCRRWTTSSSSSFSTRWRYLQARQSFLPVFPQQPLVASACPAPPSLAPVLLESDSFPAPVLALSAVAREGGGSASEAGCRDSPPGSAGRRQGGSAYAISLATSERAPPYFRAPSLSRRKNLGFAEVHLTQQGHRQTDADTLRRCDARRLKKKSSPALSPQL